MRIPILTASRRLVSVGRTSAEVVWPLLIQAVPGMKRFWQVSEPEHLIFLIFGFHIAAVLCSSALARAVAFGPKPIARAMRCHSIRPQFLFVFASILAMFFSMSVCLFCLRFRL